MSARAGEWHLLGEGADPVPGDSSSIATEARHFTSLAEEIEHQVALLRRLAAGGEAIGAHADSIRGNLEGTAGDLERVRERFEVTGSQLRTWAEDVETARSVSASALAQAEAAERTLAANPEPPFRLPFTEVDPQQAADDAATERVRAQAEHLGEEARQQWARGSEQYEDAAERTASALRAAADDGLADSWWEDVKAWVSRNADWLTLVADVISWVVVAVAVVVLFISPVGWVLAAIAVIGAIGVGIRGLLAASGEGSWADFGIEVIGLLTLGTGRLALSVAKVGRKATLSALARTRAVAAKDEAIEAALRAFGSASWLRKPGVWMTRSNPIARRLQGRAAYDEAFERTIRQELPELGPLARIRAGGNESSMTALQMRREIAEIRRLDPDLMTRAYDVGSRVSSVTGGASAVQLFGHNLMSENKTMRYPGWEAYTEFKRQIDETVTGPR